jgi:hypothetical protein
MSSLQFSAFRDRALGQIKGAVFMDRDRQFLLRVKSIQANVK